MDPAAFDGQDIPLQSGGYLLFGGNEDMAVSLQLPDHFYLVLFRKTAPSHVMHGIENVETEQNIAGVFCQSQFPVNPPVRLEIIGMQVSQFFVAARPDMFRPSFLVKQSG